MKFCEKCFEEIATKDGDNRCPQCDGLAPKPKTKRKRRTRKEMQELAESLGMTMVRGAMGGVYME